MGNLFYSGKHSKKKTGTMHEKTASVEVQEYYDEEYLAVEPAKKAPAKKGRKALIAICSIAAVLAVIVGSGLLFYNSKLGKLNYDDSQKAENVSESVSLALANMAGESKTGADIIKEADTAAEMNKESAEENAGKVNAAAAGKTTETSTAPDTKKEENPDDTLDIGNHEVKEGGSTKTAKEAINEKNIYNILVIGSDMKIPGTMDRGRADAVMLVSLNKSTGDIKLCSFERAMGVPVEGQKDSKLNDTLNIGDAILIQNIISECFSVNIDGFVHLDYDSFPQIIDAIGGIDLYFPEKEAKSFNGRITLDARSTFVAVEGDNHLGGYEALIYCRHRDGDDNWGRQGRTRAVVSAAVDKVKSLSLKELNKLADTVLPLIHTNLTKSQISSIMLSAPKFLSPEISQMMIPDQDKIWVYHGEGDEAMYGYDFDYETDRLHEFILATSK